MTLAAWSGGELVAGEAEPASAVRVAETGFSFARPPFVHPRIVLDFNTWWSDVGDQIVGINLLDAQGSNRYHGAIETRQNEGQCPTVLWRRPPEDGAAAGWFSYRYVGMTSAGVHVLVVQDAGGGSSVFTELRLLALQASPGIEPQLGFDFDGGTATRQDQLWDAVVRPTRPRIVARSLGTIPLGDRWAGDVRVRANDVFIGRDQGLFAGSDGSSNWNADRWLALDMSPSAPLDLAAQQGACDTRLPVE